MKTNEPDCVLIKKRDYEILKGNQDELISKYDIKIATLKKEIEDLKNTPPQIDPIKLTINLVEDIKRIENGYCKEYYSNPLPYIKEANIELDKPLRVQILTIANYISKKVVEERNFKIEELGKQLTNYFWTSLAEMSFLERLSYLRNNLKKYKNESK